MFNGKIHTPCRLACCLALSLCLNFFACSEPEVDCKGECDTKHETCQALCLNASDNLKKLECWLTCNELFENCCNNCEQLKQLEDGGR
jgi:hypothetical protein